MTYTQKKTISILRNDIEVGESKEISFSVANLHTSSHIDVPVFVKRAKRPGPVVLITAGIHGDEINGVEIVRQVVHEGINKPKRGTIICMPVINAFGFVNMSREFPDGRDLNRVFPGYKNGSLASRVAYKLVHEVLHEADFIMDFHTGGAGRFNAPQVRIVKDHPELDELAQVFGAPFVLYSKNLKKTFRSICKKKGKPALLFEGGKSFHIDENVTQTGVEGIKRVLNHLGMLSKKFKPVPPKDAPIFIHESRWQRANYSGMFKQAVTVGQLIKKGEIIGSITDPYGKKYHKVKAKYSGYVINVNEAPIVYQGDALFRIS